MPHPSLLSQTKHWLKKHHIRVSKRLGQHFLINDAILERIIQCADLSENHRVLEIGSGNGVLTRALAKHVQRVYAIEQDPHLFQILLEELSPNPKISLIQGDAVKSEWPKCDRLVANLPYSISSPVLFRFFEAEIPTAVLMLQKEFAERLEAQPGTKQYGRLTVMTAYYAEVEVKKVVPPEAFYPPPKVASTITRIQRRTQPAFSVNDLRVFSEVTAVLFNQRRKKILSPIRSLVGEKRLEILREKIPWLDQRVEDLSPEQIAAISNAVEGELRE
ncbi:MAG: 16S rRNA (adenine(1518)-N(6)/adenine(1519)-N(6))-dimethyltransferase RsmA [Candidatus Hodarchaeota archaeon]